jgi:hypothetical protein
MTKTQESESKKNIQAGSYTALVCVLMLVIFFFVKWGMPPLPEPPMDEGIEVNLGNSDAGMGNDQPFEPGYLHLCSNNRLMFRPKQNRPKKM